MKTKISSVVAAVGSLLLLIASSSATSAATVTIFNDFGPGNTFQFSQAAPVAGSNSVFGYHAFAMPFTSPFEANVTQIDLGLLLIGAASDSVNVSLNINDGGTLGRALQSWSLSNLNLPPFGSTNSSVTTIDNIHGAHLKVDGSYYLYVTPADSTTNVAWNINSIGTIDTRLVFAPDEMPQLADLSAFRIFGTPTPPNQVPVPPALPLFATGLGALGLLGWRRKRKAIAA
jgi:hypothetical protein